MPPTDYSELIRSDIPESSSAKLAQLPVMRSSPPSVMKPSLPPVSKSSSSFALEPLITKPTRGELRARLEVLAKKKRSVKRKTQASPEGCPSARGKILNVGVSSSPSSAVGAGDSSGRAAEPPLEVLPILVWSPTLQGAKPPPPMSDDVGRGSFGVVGDEVALLSQWNSPLGLFPPSFAIPTSRWWTPYPLRRLWLLRFREPLLYVQEPSSVRFLIVSDC